MPFDLASFDPTTEDGAEAALDALGLWFTEQLVLAGADDAVASRVMLDAITAFYDIREASELPRGMYARHFFLVDGIGIQNSDRPIPWVELHSRVTAERLEQLHGLFNAAERLAR